MRHLLLLLLPTALRAQYVMVTPPDKQPRVELDTTRMVVADASLLVWFRWEGAPADTTLAGKHYVTRVERSAIRCDAEEIAGVADFYYNGDGAMVDSYDYTNAPRRWSSVPPGSYFEAQVRTACRVAKRKGLRPLAPNGVKDLSVGR